MERRVRILHVMTGYLKYDGPTVSVLRYAEAMDREAVQIDFAACNQPPEDIARRMKDMGCRLFVLPARLKKPVRYFLELKKLIAREKFDVVQVHGNSCTMALDLLAAKMGGAPVRAPYSMNSQCKYRVLHKLLRPAFDRLYTDAWACGDEAGKWLYPGKPFRVARIAVETAKYAFDPEARERCRREMGVTDEIVIGSVANFNVQKNHPFLLDVFADYHKINPASRLVLVGDGPQMGNVRMRIAQLGIGDCVSLPGSRSDVPQLIQAFDAMLLPSLYEGFPNVLVEWQCAGLRSFVSDTVTSAAALTPLVTFLPISDGVQPWTEELIRFVPPENRWEISRAAVRQIVEKGYDIAASAAEVQKFYLEAAERKHDAE